jgi:hypothetical protein
MESTKDDEIPVNVADTGESGFGFCFCLRRASLIAGIRHGGYAWTYFSQRYSWELCTAGTSLAQPLSVV